MKNLIAILFLCFSFFRLAGQFCTPQDQCSNAPLFCGYALQNQIWSNAVPMYPQAFSPLCGPNFTTHNSNWFRIIPCSPNLELVIEVQGSSTGDGLQAALYSDCSSNATVACNPGQEFGAGLQLYLSATVVPGQEYWLQVDGFAGDICTYVIGVISGLNTAMPPPPPPAPFAGIITADPAGPVFCGIGTADFSVDWPGCATFQKPQLPCYTPKEDSCKGIKWTLPPGAKFVGDPYANPVTIDFHMVAPGNYTIKARPMDCACPADLCPECGPLCCPVEEAEMEITITAPSVTVLPEIELCLGDWPPACALLQGGSVNGFQATCAVEDPIACHITVQPYRVPNAQVNNLGEVAICENDSVIVCGTVYTIPGDYTHICSCDSAVVISIVKDLSCFNDCANYNYPAPPGDHCEAAPFLCGNYLEGYCTSNFGLDNDTLLGTPMGNAGFLRFAPCENEFDLEIAVRNCTNETGMQFRWSQSSDCEFDLISAPITIFNNASGHLSLPTALQDSTYFLIFSGIGGDQCEVSINHVSGIGTADPGILSCACTDGFITGPTKVCPRDIAVYTITPANCTITGTPPSGGNGYSCCPSDTPSEVELDLIWHVPPFMTFLSDSVNVTTITVQIDSSFIGIDTTITGLVWASYVANGGGSSGGGGGGTTTGGPTDTLVFCDCPTIFCSFNVTPLQVTMTHEVKRFSCELNCFNPDCEIEGIVYTAPFSDTISTNCLTKIIQVTDNFSPPTMFIPLAPPITCINPQVALTCITSGLITDWDGPGIGNPTTTTITASFPGNYICYAMDPSTGCIGIAIRTVQINNFPPVASISPGPTICMGETVSLSATSNFPSSNFKWSSTQNTSTILVTPGVTTTYTVTVTNNSNGCTSTAQTTVTVKPQDINELGEVGQITCSNPCFNFMGQTFCSPGVYEIEESFCLKHRFSIGENLIPITVVYPAVQVCPGECYEFLDHTFCSAGLFVVEENCTKNYLEIQMAPPLTAAVTAPPPVCEGTPSTLTVSATGTSPLIYLWSTGENSPMITVSPTQTTSYSVTLTDGNGCTEAVSAQVAINELQIVQAGIVGAINCNNPCTSFMGNNYCEAGPFIIEENCVRTHFEIAFVRDTVEAGIVGILDCTQNCLSYQGQNYCAAGTYNLVDSCSVYHFIIEENTALPPLTFNQPEILTCVTTNTTLVAQTNASATVVWNGPGVFNQTGNIISVSAPGSYSCTAADPNNGCSTVASVDVLQETTVPTVVIPQPDTLNCQILSVSLNAITDPNNMIIWAGPGIVGQAGNGTLVNTPGNYLCTVTDLANGCTNTAGIDIVQDIMPPVVITSSSPVICQGQSALLSATSTAPFNTYFWSTGATTASMVVSPAITTTYFITVTNTENGCTGTGSALLPVSLPIALVMSADTTICAGEVVNINVLSTGGTPPLGFAWSTGDTASGITVMPLQTSQYQITVTDAVGCTQTGVTSVNVNEMQVEEVGVAGFVSCADPCFVFMGNTYCAPGQYTVENNCTQTNFSIAFTKDTVNAGVAGVITCSQACVVFQSQNICQAGNYTVEDSCTVYHFEVNSNLAAPTCSTPSLNCLPGNNNYTVGFTITGVQPYKINSTPIIGSYYLSEPIASGEQYNFIVEQTTNGCQTLLTGSYDCVQMCTGTTAALGTNSLSACIGESIEVEVISPAQPSADQIAMYCLHNSAAVSPDNILLQNTTGVFAFDAALLVPETVYFVSSAVGPPNGAGGINFSDPCALISAGQPIVFHQSPGWQSLEVVPPTCFGQNDGEIMITATGTAPFEFSINMGAWSDQPHFEGLGAGTYQIAISDGRTCRADSTITLAIPDSVWLTLGPDIEITSGTALLLVPQGNAVAPVYEWEEEVSGISFTGPVWEVRPAQSTRYSCTVTDANGCTAIASLRVKILPDGVFVPNIITPETGDPSNQKFTIFAQEGYLQEVISLQVYDRWGSRVFSKAHFAPNDPLLGWDGTVKNKLLRPDVFTFVALVKVYDGTEKMIKGDITVAR